MKDGVMDCVTDCTQIIVFAVIGSLFVVFGSSPESLLDNYSKPRHRRVYSSIDSKTLLIDKLLNDESQM